MSNDHLSDLLSSMNKECNYLDKTFENINETLSTSMNKVDGLLEELDKTKIDLRDTLIEKQFTDLNDIAKKVENDLIDKLDFDFGSELEELEEEMRELNQTVDWIPLKKKTTPNVKLSKLSSVFTQESLIGKEVYNPLKPDLALPVKPIPPIVGLGITWVWIKYRWNTLLGRDIKAKSLYDVYVNYQNNKADVINRYVTIKRSKLGNQYGLSPLSTISAKWFISDYWSFMPFKPVLDHFIWKAINSNDFSHPLLAGLFDKRHSTKERTACFNMVVNYWDDISESHQYSIINKVNENRRTASAETKQEIEDLLEILKVVY
ncbi:hypothetical protein [Shewanella phage FishSpeaker]|nr:hypothetical protein [Shewanella phage FishSpeaker]